MAEASMTSLELSNKIYHTKFRYHSEKSLQHQLGLLFNQLNLMWNPEVILSPKDRIDFMVDDGIGIEVKTDDSSGGASLASVTRQLFRYSQFESVKSLILVTSRSKHLSQPAEMNSKPLAVVYLVHSFL